VVKPIREDRNVVAAKRATTRGIWLFLIILVSMLLRFGMGLDFLIIAPLTIGLVVMMLYLTRKRKGRK